MFITFCLIVVIISYALYDLRSLAGNKKENRNGHIK